MQRDDTFARGYCGIYRSAIYSDMPGKWAMVDILYQISALMIKYIRVYV